jgi:hypothetical protein
MIIPDGLPPLALGPPRRPQALKISGEIDRAFSEVQGSMGQCPHD